MTSVHGLGKSTGHWTHIWMLSLLHRNIGFKHADEPSLMFQIFHSLNLPKSTCDHQRVVASQTSMIHTMPLVLAGTSQDEPCIRLHRLVIHVWVVLVWWLGEGSRIRRFKLFKRVWIASEKVWSGRHLWFPPQKVSKSRDASLLTIAFSAFHDESERRSSGKTDLKRSVGNHEKVKSSGLPGPVRFLLSQMSYIH